MEKVQSYQNEEDTLSTIANDEFTSSSPRFNSWRIVAVTVTIGLFVLMAYESNSSYLSFHQKSESFRKDIDNKGTNIVWY